MRRLFFGIISILFLTCGLTGCSTAGEKAVDLSTVYSATAIISLILLIACCILVRKTRIWFILLFSSVLIVNIGYTFLSVSTNLEAALWGNRIAYLGSVFLPLAMLMIILNVTGTKYPKRLHGALGIISILVFLIAASPGVLPVYYKEVSFEIINGVGKLIKVYGPLHPLYLVYLLVYFGSMVAVIIRSTVKKTVDNFAHSIVLAIAVFVNLGVWSIEQMSSIDFEFLSVSYIISELFLLGVHLVMQENQRLKELIKQKEKELQRTECSVEAPNNNVSDEVKLRFENGVKSLTPTERQIFDAYLEGRTTKEIMSMLNIKENTLKFHNKNLYSKLGVSSRKQLIEIGKTR